MASSVREIQAYTSKLVKRSGVEGTLSIDASLKFLARLREILPELVACFNRLRLFFAWELAPGQLLILACVQEAERSG